MIPRSFINAWRAVAPWSNDAQIEQDLILSRALVEIFSNRFLKKHLAFRGGTALNKLFFVESSRYSEDIDLVQIQAGPIGEILTHLRKQLDSWLGIPKRSASEGNAVLGYRFESESQPIQTLKLKVEINTREHFSVLGFQEKAFKVDNPWFQGGSEITTYRVEELLGTKLRALYQRKKGRDLYDPWKAFQSLSINPEDVIRCFQVYLEHSGLKISRAEFEKNLALKKADKAFNEDIFPLLRNPSEYDPQEAFRFIEERLIAQLPGNPWKAPKPKNG